MKLLSIKSLSMKTQILVLTLVLVAVSLAFLMMLTIIHMKDEMYGDIEKRAVSIISILSSNVGPGIEFDDTSYVKEIVMGAFDDEDILGICVCGQNDKTLFFNSRDVRLHDYEANCPVPDTFIVRHDDNMVVVAMAIVKDGMVIGDIWMALSKDSMNSRIRSSVIYLLSLSLLVLLVVFAAGSIISSRIVNPIKSFEAAAKRIQEGDMVTAIDVTPLNKDFIPLGMAFNKMSTSLDNAFDELKASRQNLEVQVEIRTSELQTELVERKKSEKLKKERLERVQNQRIAISRLLTEETVIGGDFKSAIGRIIEIVSAALNVEQVGIWMFDQEKTELECIDQFEASKEKHSAGLVLKMSDYPKYFEAIRKERTIACNNARTDPRTSEFTEGYLVPLGIVSMIDSSILVSGERLGVICVEHVGELREWKDDEIAFIDEISGQLAQVYSNAERMRAEDQKDHLKEELERAQRMESLGILAGGVAHDLNNMLGPLVGYPELILMKLPEDSPMRKQVERIGRSAKDAADVIQDLLTLARRGRYEMEPTNLVEVVESYLDSPSYHKLTEERAEIIVNYDFKDKFLFINGSPPHLSKVVMNLIFNAMDAMPNAGSLNISVSQESIDKLYGGFGKIDRGDYVILRVRDTGTGIDAEDLDKIFEPYYSKKKMGSSSGSGLGLSVVYGIIKDHHGYYDIFSTKGKGTEFVLYFQAIDKPIENASKTEDEIGGQETILVVDDAPEQREIAFEFLTNLGYKVEMVENGHKAIDYLSKNKVDLVLMDMIMEKDFDGLDAYREILKIHPGQKAVIISGFSATERVDEMLSLGAGSYVKKPFTFGVLSKAIREELDRKSNSKMLVT